MGIKKAGGLMLIAFSLSFNSLQSQQIQPIANLNSPYDEQHPVLSPTGELFFTIGFHPENSGGPTDYGDIWMSKKSESGIWQKPVRVLALSTSGNDVVIGFSDVLTLFVYHDGNGRKQGIHQYSKFGNSWNYIRPLEMGNFKNNSKHFSGRLNADGSVLIMALASFGSFGNEDIYVSFKKTDGVWTSPQNLGSQINTFAQEMTPFLTEDMNTLYFSSNAKENDRGKDIYYSNRLDDSWSNWSIPQPLQFVNTVGSEQSYVQMAQNNDLAIFTTTQNSEGFGDLMTVMFEEFEVSKDTLLIESEIAEVPQPTESEIDSTFIQEAKPAVIHDDVISNSQEVEAVPENKEIEMDPEEPTVVASSEPVEEILPGYQPVSILDAGTQENLDHSLLLINSRGIKKAVNDQNDLAIWLGEGGWSNIVVTSKGYLPQTISVAEWADFSIKNIPVLMKPAQAGTSIVLNNIQFNRGTSDFADAKSIQDLDNLADFLIDNPDVRIRLEGHTDNAGDPVLNKELSLNRASKIRGYLTLNGVEFERVRISGWGGLRPVAANDTEEGRIQNRRVEMLIER